MKISSISSHLLWAAILLILPGVVSAVQTTEKRTFTITLTGYRNGDLVEKPGTTGTVTYQQPQQSFRIGNADLIKSIGALKGTPFTNRPTMFLDGNAATLYIVNAGVTNALPFDSELSMDFWQDSFAERLSGNYNVEKDTGSGSSSTVESWTVSIKIGTQSFTLKGSARGSESWRYAGETASESSRQTIRVTGEWSDGAEACPIEGSITISYSSSTK